MADYLETQATPSSSDSVSIVDFSSDNESLNTTTSTTGNSVFSRLRRARSIRDQAKEVSALTAAPTSFTDYPLLNSADGFKYVLENIKPTDGIVCAMWNKWDDQYALNKEYVVKYNGLSK